MKQPRHLPSGKAAVWRTLHLSAVGLLSLAAAFPSWGQSSPQAEVKPVTPLTELALQRLRARLTPLTPDQESQRQVLLAQARAKLAQGAGAEAMAHLDQAAGMAHMADTEMLMVQAHLQQGQYRQGLTFASHTAGAHLYEPQALTLYVWMLAMLDQKTEAARMLDQGLQRMPGSTPLIELQQRLQSLTATKASALSGTALPGPPATGSVLPQDAQLIGHGLLLAGGRQAVVPMPNALPPGASWWVRNGLGQGHRAKWVASLADTGLALVELETPVALPGPPPARAHRDAFAGSEARVLAALPTASSTPTWPALYKGFLGRVSARSNQQALGIETPEDSRGGPVFNGLGQWTGMALPASTAGGEPRLVPMSQLQAALQGSGSADVFKEVAPAAQLSDDQLYEQALPYTAQLWFKP